MNEEKWRTCKAGFVKIKGCAQALRRTKEKQFKSQRGRKLPLDMTTGNTGALRPLVTEPQLTGQMQRFQVLA